ncbi:MAG: DUF4258 domain-containing protein [Gammaproteobacteria bacterium]|nr:DUF4258 domain-containing protein [Gammaproteobacteria bacterium]
MSERDIFIDDVFRVLRTGSVNADPIRTDRGEWQCKIAKRIKDTRSVGVVTIIFHEEKLFPKTVEWEDLR